MLYLFCVTFDVEVEITGYEGYVERAEAADRMDRSKYLHVVEVTGSYNFHPVTGDCDESDSGDGLAAEWVYPG